MRNDSPPLPARLSHWFEKGVVWLVQAILIVVILMALIYLWILMWRAFADGRWLSIESVPQLQNGLQRALAGVLLVILALELREALRNYFVEHRVRVEVILSLALIAVGRHIIQLDYEHAPGSTLIGVALLIVSLVGSLCFLQMRQAGTPARTDVDRREG